MKLFLNTYTDVIATRGGWTISDTVTYQLVLCDDVIMQTAIEAHCEK